MIQSTTIFSPILLTGIFLQPLPKTPVNAVVKKISKRLCRNHPEAIKRLHDIIGTCFVIEPTDLPYSIEMTVTKDTLNTQLYSPKGTSPDVKISGPLLSLIGMLDSKVDGDALFFSREISVQGNTEALLTLRNALDSEDINFRDELLDMFGPLRKPSALLATGVERIAERASKDMKRISDSITVPLTLQKNSLQSEVADLRGEIIDLKKLLSRQQKNIERLAKKVAQ